MQAKKGICTTRVNNFVRVVCKVLRDVQNYLLLLNSRQQKMGWMLFFWGGDSTYKSGSREEIIVSLDLAHTQIKSVCACCNLKERPVALSGCAEKEKKRVALQEDDDEKGVCFCLSDLVLMAGRWARACVQVPKECCRSTFALLLACYMETPFENVSQRAFKSCLWQICSTTSDLFSACIEFWVFTCIWGSRDCFLSPYKNVWCTFIYFSWHAI